MKAIIRILLAITVAVVLVGAAFLGGYGASQALQARNAAPALPAVVNFTGRTPAGKGLDPQLDRAVKYLETGQ